MAMLREFREFAVKGNVIDLAVAVIIGGAFGKIVDSVVNDLIMPLVGAVFGGLDFSSNFIPLKPVPPGTVYTLEAMKAANVPVFAWGHFVTIALNFVILAFIIFQMVRLINHLKRTPEQAPTVPVPPSEEIVLLREIRDGLVRR
jgi:large conductance mechanosensitive channel